jgi:hypothetical protein
LIKDVYWRNIFYISFRLNLVTLLFNKGFIQFSGKVSFKYLVYTKKYEEVYPVISDLGLLRLLEKTIIDAQIDASRVILKM